MNNLSQIGWLIPALPMLGFLINGLGRNKLSKTFSGLAGSSMILLSFLLSIYIFIQVKNGVTVSANYFTFINTHLLKVDFAFVIDPLTAVFLLIITGVGFLIHVYSISYMQEENPRDFARYFSFLNLFVFSMLLLVMASGFLIMFMGWEGVGLCSYLLIGYWFKNNRFNAAAKKAFVMNRIGDLGFLLAIFWLVQETGTTEFSLVFSSNSLAKLSGTDITWITLFLFIGATGKSAQIPLYTWLPDAMAGPTPVSALIHAATMVTAGIYMIVRCHALFSLSSFTMELIAITGLATALLAATIAIYQNDIKKVLAYSTVSQLGFMFLALGVGAYSSGVFHVMTHAFFKALLFLGAGSVIHSMSGEQDIIKMGGLRKKIPVTYITFLIGVLAIAGFPFTSGFISKDEILLQVYAHNKIYFYLAAIGAVMTAFYMFRLLMLTFFGDFRGTEKQERHLHESSRTMTIPLMVLAVLSVVGGLVQLPHVFGGHPYFSDFLNPVVPSIESADAALATKEIIILAATIIGLAVIYFITKKYYTAPKTDVAYTGFRKFLANKWYVDELYDSMISKPLALVSKFFNGVVEKKGVDGFVNGVGRAVHYSSRQLRLLQSGNVGAYILLMVAGIIILFVIQLFFSK
jgi:NADH-quinone oxidoreductase subunit L